MKKTTLVFAFMFFAFFDFSFSETINIGLKGGVNYSRITGEQGGYFGGTSSTLFNFGLFGEIDLNNYLSIQPELLFTVKGNQLYPDSAPINYYYDFNYLELPVLLKAKVFSVEKFEFNALLGPYAAFLLSESYKPYPPSNFTSPLVGSYNVLDLGYALGLSVEIENFVLEGRFEHGFKVSLMDIGLISTSIMSPIKFI
jgi:hypothetical protein